MPVRQFLVSNTWFLDSSIISAAPVLGEIVHSQEDIMLTIKIVVIGW